MFTLDFAPQKLVPTLEAARERIYRHSLKLEDARAYAGYGQHSSVGANQPTPGDLRMTRNAMPEKRQPTLAPVDDDIDHVRGPTAGRLIVEYGDYECPYSRQAFREIERVEQRLGGGIRFAFRHFPLTRIHPHALAAAAAAEAAALQDRFWDMHELLFHRQKALEDDDLRRYAADLGLDVARFDQDRAGAGVLARIDRDVESGTASGEVQGTPTLFIDGVVHLGGYDAATLMEALTG
jgi:protein-disulfide isomerase